LGVALGTAASFPFGVVPAAVVTASSALGVGEGVVEQGSRFPVKVSAQDLGDSVTSLKFI